MSRLNTKAFGLVEVLIAAGLLTMVGLALSQILVSGNKGQGTIQAQSDMVNLQSLIRMETTVNANCMYNFALPNPNANTATYAVTTLPVFIPASFALTKGLFYPSGAQLIGPAAASPIWGNGLTIKTLALYFTQSLGSGNYIGAIHIEGTKGPATVVGGTTFSADVPMTFATSGAGPITITSCSSLLLTPISCPGGWTIVGTGNEAFCISPILGPAWIYAAVSACAGINAHLCDVDEWMNACAVRNVPGFDSATTQWAGPMFTGCAPPGCYMYFGGGCGPISGIGPPTAYGYRCCSK